MVDPPTLVSLGFEWRISGDDNRNAHVDVTYRKKGEQRVAQRPAAAARCSTKVVSGGTPREGAGHYFSYVRPTCLRAASSISSPDTEYECRFVLSDPDGVKGKAEKTVTVRTRKEPQPAAGGHVYHVYPFG